MRAVTYLGAFFGLTLAVGGLSGCAAVPIMVAGAGSGINFTPTTAYRTFTYPQDQVHAAALKTLVRMQIKKITSKKSGGDIQMTGKTKHLAIYITLTSITPMLTKASVNAKKNWFMKDQTVAAEILIQMDQVLQSAAAAK